MNLICSIAFFSAKSKLSEIRKVFLCALWQRLVYFISSLLFILSQTMGPTFGPRKDQQRGQGWSVDRKHQQVGGSLDDHSDSTSLLGSPISSPPRPISSATATTPTISPSGLSKSVSSQWWNIPTFVAFLALISLLLSVLLATGALLHTLKLQARVEQLELSCARPIYTIRDHQHQHHHQQQPKRQHTIGDSRFDPSLLNIAPPNVNIHDDHTVLLSESSDPSSLAALEQLFGTFRTPKEQQKFDQLIYEVSYL